MVVVVIRAEPDVKDPPGTVCFVSNSLDDTGNAIALLELLLEAFSFLLQLRVDKLLLLLDRSLELLDFGLERSKLTDVVFQE